MRWYCAPLCLHLQSRTRGWNASRPPFTILRLLTPLKISYEAAKKRAEPYTRIVGELPEMRQTRWNWSRRPWLRTGERTCW